MAKGRRQNKISSMGAKRQADLCINESVAQAARRLIGCSTPRNVVETLWAQIRMGKSYVDNVNVLQYDVNNNRLCCGTRCTKYSVDATTLHDLKLAAADVVDCDHKFDCLLVSAMWTKGTAEPQIYECELDHTVYLYQTYNVKGWFGSSAVIRYSYLGNKYYWIDINCPTNMLTAVSSGSVSLSEGPVERELSWSCEMRSTDYELELSL